MMEQLVVRLGSVLDDPIHWLLWSTQQKEIIASGELANVDELASLKDRVSQRNVIALVPTSDVLMTQVALPAKAARKAATVVPFMLEEELAGDISQQFFAYADRVADQQQVAVISVEKVETWLGWLESAGFHCHKLIPDVLALPYQEGNWSLLTLGEQLLVRQDLWQGLQGESQWLLDAVSLQAKKEAEGLNVTCYNDIDLSLTANIHHQVDNQAMPMQTLATGAIGCKFNLLQGQFAVKSQASSNWKQWRLVAGLAALALVVSLVDKKVELNTLIAEKDALKAQTIAEYKKAFPNSRVPRNVRNQLKKQLATMQQGGTSTSMLGMMSQLAPVFSASQVKPQTIRFDRNRGELRMQAEAANFSNLEQFKQLAEQQGLTVDQGAINNRDNIVVGSLVIKS